ncbi:Nramp family divalent metal transporter [Congregibacter litoralis]|uniref:Mn2+ and Fe2+ transporter of the NRAMP family n=1 Tax=Congregibacter litoralis KT71 TaxID=314285 RepID=A4ACN2_9GAMM|nr:Nramp family divalent metal transporter [Congregibacter litoralis]EAQ96246.1 Mn2+ and Fe2+ transporter of the NRAMP family [Congregibacter litoralis KT71]
MNDELKTPQRRKWGFGPGLLVAAAFVGPGTIATASAAGAGYGYALLWALLFSVLATMALQEMSVRQAIITGKGLATTLREALAGHWLGRGAILLVVAAIGLGNAAYESGNIAGAAIALESVSTIGTPVWALGIGGASAALLFLPAYQQLERVLIALVLLMSIIFVASAVLLRPDWSALFQGFTPRLPEGSLTTVIALIGTTVVPYNLFLQANAAREHWADEPDRDLALSSARLDTVLSVSLGGLVTLAIVSAAAMTFFAQGLAFEPDKITTQLEPVLGSAGRYVFAAGLCAAGLTSAITAPLAAAYAVCGALGLTDTLRGGAFRVIALAVVFTGTVFAATGARPLSLIVFAQAANGLLLPIIAVILVWLMNNRRLLGDATNGWRSNLLGVIVIGVTLGLGANKLAGLIG